MVQRYLVVYIDTALMLVTSIIYFIVAFQDYTQLLQSSSSSSNIQDILATRNEMIFFIIVGIAYIPIAIWMLIAKYGNLILYSIAIAGSAALIIFYILTRSINIPYIGLQTDTGAIDITAKILQGAIVFMSMYILKRVKYTKHQLAK
ncbi:MAG TPA: hypothetical protein VEL11_16175 [Candidatus Bathyarchaeia archaeon]|nr:hypothetical protein [Candidatus Bathyarchaeia archaeon]